MRVKSLFAFVFFIVLHVNGQQCGPKIDSTFCRALSKAGANEFLSFQLTVHNPISQPDLSKIPGDSAIAVKKAYYDSLNGYWASIVPKLDSLIVKYDLRAPGDTSKRPVVESFPEFVMYFSAVKASILALGQEQIVDGMKLNMQTFPWSVAVVPDSLVSSSAFPFDTVLSGYDCLGPSNVSPHGGAEFFIGRFGLPVFLAPPQSLPAIQPLPITFDFIFSAAADLSLDYEHIKYPQDNSALLRGEIEPCVNCGSYLDVDSSYLTHEYRFPTTSSFLYMKVIGAYTCDSMKIRFDTASFLSGARARNLPVSERDYSRISVWFRNGRLFVAGNSLKSSDRVLAYDPAGRKIFDAFVGPAPHELALGSIQRTGAIVVRIVQGTKITAFRQIIVR